MKSAFVTSAVAPEGFPKERLPEIAMAGRSNVGKSTLINALVRQRLARTSGQPGKTRLANFYRVAPGSMPPFHLVDLPGYGYAGGGAAAAREFAAITGAYFEDHRRERLAGVLLLVDSRHPGLEPDRQAWAWLGTTGVPRHLVATKIDKLSRARRATHLQDIARIHDGPVLGVSAETGEGLKQLWNLLDTLLRTPRSKTAPPPPPARPTP